SIVGLLLNARHPTRPSARAPAARAGDRPGRGRGSLPGVAPTRPRSAASLRGRPPVYRVASAGGTCRPRRAAGPRGLSMSVAVHESRVTSVQKSVERRRYFPGASVDVTDARKRRPEAAAFWPPLWPGIRLEIPKLTVQCWGSSYVRPNRGRRPMTEWNAGEYNRHSSLQAALAEEQLGRLTLGGAERVLDIGCGDGKITAEVAPRGPPGPG